MKKYQFATIILFCLVCLGFNLNAQTGNTALDAFIAATGATATDQTLGTAPNDYKVWTVTVDASSDSLKNREFFKFGGANHAKAGLKTGKTGAYDFRAVRYVIVATGAKSPTTGQVADQTLLFGKDLKVGAFFLNDVSVEFSTWATGGDLTDETLAKHEGALGDDKSDSAPLATATNAAKMPWQK